MAELLAIDMLNVTAFREYFKVIHPHVTDEYVSSFWNVQKVSLLPFQTPNSEISVILFQL